ncbi:hypothetical protein H7K13_02495 [Priestia aryabhattai]|uniref:hypothetical protein n=1 Tax=Priestia TaxID=2800373 RepID=UPI001C8DA8F0|nr:hypothetical protein [Priestia aryabhattai]MBY0073792.1 hypothetical protein [Priestia aryabhattai]MCL9634742.1 hypothetical protein [Bacillus zanthoxyli]
MSYYDKKIIKGSHKKDDYCKDDYCKKGHHKEEECYEEEYCTEEPKVGVVTSGSLLTLAVTGNPIPLPLTQPILVTDDVRISPTGGIIVPEDGEYLVEFSAGVLVASVTGSLSVYADSKFLGNVGSLSVLGLANFAKIVRLRKGDLVQVVANGPIAAGVLNQGTLTVAKLED